MKENESFDRAVKTDGDGRGPCICKNWQRDEKKKEQMQMFS